VDVAVAATNEAGHHASMRESRGRGAKGTQAHHYPYLTQTTGQSRMEGVGKGCVKEVAYSLRTSWGTFQQRAGLSCPVRREVGEGVVEMLVCLNESVGGTLHLETSFQTGHRAVSGRRQR
jgi:hypothetical protein